MSTQKVVARELEKLRNHGLRRKNDRLVYARLRANLTQDDVADSKSVSVRTVSRWETREGYPMKSQTIRELAEIYNASYPWLLDGHGFEDLSYEQGLELEYLEQVWYKLHRDKQIATYDFIKSLNES